MKFGQSKYEISLQLAWTISVLALFFHGKIPYMLPLSVSSFLISIAGIAWLSKDNLSTVLKHFVHFTKNSWAYLVLGLIYLGAVANTEQRDLLLLKESIYIFYIWFEIALFYFLILP